MVPDLLHYYGVDLRDLFRDDDPLEPRWVLTLILGLPVESAYHAELMGGQQFRGWTPAVWAAAMQANTLQSIQYLYILAHLDPKKGGKPKPPTPFPTPESKSKREAKPQNAFGRTAYGMLAASRRRKVGG